MNLAVKWAVTATLWASIFASLFHATIAPAQTTTGDATIGASLWASKGCGNVACHAPTAKPVNAANAGGHITYAIAQGMPASVTPAEANNIAAYLATFVPDPNPVNVTIPFNTGTSIPLPNIFLGSTYGKFTNLQTATAPIKGSVSYSGTTATYTPTAGQTGTDSFRYRAIVAGGCTGGCSNDRTVTVNISSQPPAVLSLFKEGTGSGTVVSSPPGINCGTLCLTSSASFAPGTVVTLTATADPDSFLVSLNRQPTNTVQLTMNANDNAFVTFNSLANDNFANRLTLVPTLAPGNSFAEERRFNFGATKEAGEPNHAGNAGGRSLWYSWTAPFTGSVNIATGSNVTLRFSDFNTLLAVYTGTALNALTLVAENDNVPPNFLPNANSLLSSVTFQAIAGTTYQIAVDGSNTTGTAETGKVDLTVIQPGNDAFGARLALTGGNVTVTDANASASRQNPSEPLILGNAGGHSLWWSWTAPANGTVNINTAGSNFNTLLGVYTGTALNALTLVASNDDVTPGTVLTSAVSFTATAGTTYQIAVDGFNDATGNITLNVVQQPPLAVTSVVSRKSHGAAGPQDMPLVNRLLPLTGNIDVEPRAIGSGHRIVFQFNRTVTTPGSVAVTDTVGAPVGASVAASGNEVTVTLTSLPDRQRARFTLTNINGEGLNASASVGFLIGDFNNSRTVEPADVSAVKARSGQNTDGSNYKFDLNASGTVNSTDIATVKARVNLTLP